MRRLMLLIPILLILIGGILLYRHLHASERPYEPQNGYSNASTLTPENIISLVNQERSKANVAPLQTSPELMKSSTEKCQDEVSGNYYNHDNPVTGMHGYEYIIKYLGNQRQASENLAKGTYVTAQEPVSAWMNSPSHKQAMLDPAYTITGVAVCPLHDVEQNYDIVEHFAK